ncbi:MULTISPECIES: hypothetical protein [Bradyrhizobium]|uniref:hypothetical protein n=1 Tax=Bradyrhizobium elkanii TaxID=29448 RepID=UPI0032E42C7D
MSYTSPDGSRLVEPDALKRIRALAIRPAWTDVWICPFPTVIPEQLFVTQRTQAISLPRALPRGTGKHEYEHVVAFADALRSIRESCASTWGCAASRGKKFWQPSCISLTLR